MLLIDGYNLIFLSRKGGDKIEAEELKKLRDDLIRKLNKYADKKKATVIVVFDSSEEDYLKNSSRKKEGRVEVIYTSKEISADKMIIDIVKNSPSPSNYRVVTSDSAIVKECSKRGAKSISSEDFLRKLFDTIDLTEAQRKNDKRIFEAKEKIEGISSKEAEYWLEVFDLPEDLETD